LNEPLKKDLLVDPASNFQTTVCLPKSSVNKLARPVGRFKFRVDQCFRRLKIVI
jgi:hypothetical protein